MKNKTKAQFLMVVLFIFDTYCVFQISASRIKRSTYQHENCATEIRRNGMDLLNEGIRAIDSSIQISGRFFEALKDLYKHDRNKIYDVTKAGLTGLKKTHMTIL